MTHGYPGPLMGGKIGDWLKAKIAERKAKGVDLQLPVGKGSIGISIPGESSGAGGPGGETGPMAFVKKNPLVVAGVAGGGLLLVMLLLRKRKG